ncbi:universal stress protein [Thiocystis violacea]|uniref:universal stress protein n=1 Tax=Thiocystis violacea TaxID=13725 RepID=UPI00190531FE|nr:universal stress protein [Thiocystis violacea]MBK1724992.1 universal stress protein UspA [Thiocystis violacea]
MKNEPANRPILVPVDFSTHSEAALLCALDLAGCYDRPLLILHVVHDPGAMPGYYGRALKKKQLLRIEDGAADMLADFLRALGKQHPELKDDKKIETLLVKGLPSSRILEVAADRSAAMIVMGSKGLTGLKHLMVGSVAERVVHRAKIPVTVVKSAQASPSLAGG